MAGNKTYAAIGGGIAAVVVVAILALALPGSVATDNEQPIVEPTTHDKVEKIKIFASFYPYFEFTKNVAGDQATVEQYMPFGVEAHDWEPRARDIQSLQETDVFVYNGLGMEPYVDQIIDSGEYDHIVFVNASKDIELIKFEEDDTHAEEFAEEIMEAIEEFEEGHMTEAQVLKEIEEILHEHEGDGHGHGGDTIENIEEILHEIEEGHLSAEEGIEEIEHIVSGIEDGHDDRHEAEEDGHEDTVEEFAEEIMEAIEEFEEGHMTESQALEEILHEIEEGHEGKAVENVEEILHEIEEGHLSAEEGIEEIEHIVSGIGDGHDDRHEAEEEGHEADGHGHRHDYEFDPHIWLDPVLVKQQVNNIRDGLIQADPQNRESYEQNADAYNEKLDALDMKIKSSLVSCDKDTFVPFHNAFTYLAERYDLKIMSLSGVSPEAESSAAEIAEFVDFVKDNDIKVIFSEELVDPRLAEVIADEAGAEVLLFSPLEALAPEEVSKNVTYLEKMNQNLDALKIALECQ